MTNNIVIVKNAKGTRVVFSSAESEAEAKKMAREWGDELISFIPIELNIMLDSCVIDDGYRAAIEAFLTKFYEMGMQYGAAQMKEQIAKTVNSFMEHRFKKAGA